MSDEAAVILLRRRRIRGDTVAFLQTFVFPGTKGPDVQELQRTNQDKTCPFSDLILSQGYMIIST